MSSVSKALYEGGNVWAAMEHLDRVEAELMRALEAAEQAEREAPKGSARYWASSAADHIREAIKAAGTREKLA